MSSAPKTQAQDGRRQRSERSRRQIVEALLDVIREGNMNPSAQTVARKANVSLRTLYRLFEDLDTLYRSVGAHVEAEFMPRVEAPYRETQWAKRVDEIIDRRILIYEEILILKTAASVRRFSSDILMEYHERFVRLEHDALDRALKRGAERPPVDFETLDVFLNFETWRRLREDVGLSVEDARTRWTRLVMAQSSPSTG